MAKITNKKIKADKIENKILVKKSNNMFDIFVNNKNNADYFCIKPEHYNSDDNNLIKVIKTKTDIKLTKKDVDKILTLIREQEKSKINPE